MKETTVVLLSYFKRQVWSLALIIWPLIIFIILAITRSKFPPEKQSACYVAPRNLPSAGFFPFLQTLLCDADSSCKNISFQPQTNKMMFSERLNWSPEDANRMASFPLNGEFFDKLGIGEGRSAEQRSSLELLTQLTDMHNIWTTMINADFQSLANITSIIDTLNQTVQVEQMFTRVMTENPVEVLNTSVIVLGVIAELQNKSVFWETLLDLPYLFLPGSLDEKVQLGIKLLENMNSILQIVQKGYTQANIPLKWATPTINEAIHFLQYILHWPGRGVNISLQAVLSGQPRVSTSKEQALLDTVVVPLDKALLLVHFNAFSSYICVGLNGSGAPTKDSLNSLCANNGLQPVFERIDRNKVAEQIFLAWSRGVSRSDVRFAILRVNNLLSLFLPGSEDITSTLTNASTVLNDWLLAVTDSILLSMNKTTREITFVDMMTAVLHTLRELPGWPSVQRALGVGVGIMEFATDLLKTQTVAQKCYAFLKVLQPGRQLACSSITALWADLFTQVTLVQEDWPALLCNQNQSLLLMRLQKTVDPLITKVYMLIDVINGTQTREVTAPQILSAWETLETSYLKCIEVIGRVTQILGSEYWRAWARNTGGMTGNWTAMLQERTLEEVEQLGSELQASVLWPTVKPYFDTAYWIVAYSSQPNATVPPNCTFNSTMSLDCSSAFSWKQFVLMTVALCEEVAKDQTSLLRILRASVLFVQDSFRSYAAELLRQYLTEQANNQPLRNEVLKELMGMIVQLGESSIELLANATSLDHLNSNISTTFLHSVLETFHLLPLEAIWKEGGSSSTEIVSTVLQAAENNQKLLAALNMGPINSTNPSIHKLDSLIEKWLSVGGGLRPLMFSIGETLIMFSSLNQSELAAFKEMLQPLLQANLNRSHATHLVLQILGVFDQVAQSWDEPLALLNGYFKQLQNFLNSDVKPEALLLIQNPYIQTNSNFSQLLNYDRHQVALDMLPFLSPAALQKWVSLGADAPLTVLQQFVLFLPDSQQVELGNIVNNTARLFEAVNLCRMTYPNCTAIIYETLDVVMQAAEALHDINNNSLSILVGLASRFNNSELSLKLQENTSLVLTADLISMLSPLGATTNSSVPASTVYLTVAQTLAFLKHVVSTPDFNMITLQEGLETSNLNITELNNVLRAAGVPNASELVLEISKIIGIQECYKLRPNDSLSCTLELANKLMDLLQRVDLPKEIKGRISAVKFILQYWTEELNGKSSLLRQLEVLYDFTSVSLQNGSLVNRIRTTVTLISDTLMKIKSSMGQLDIESPEQFDTGVQILDEFIQMFVNGTYPYNMTTKTAINNLRLEDIGLYLEITEWYLNKLENITLQNNISGSLYPLFRITEMALANAVSGIELSSSLLSVVNMTKDFVQSILPFDVSDLRKVLQFFTHTIMPNVKVFMDQLLSTLPQNSTDPFLKEQFRQDYSELLDFASALLEPLALVNISTASVSIEDIVTRLETMRKNDSEYNMDPLFSLLSKDVETAVKVFKLLQKGIKVFATLESEGAASQTLFNLSSQMMAFDKLIDYMQPLLPAEKRPYVDMAVRVFEMLWDTVIVATEPAEFNAEDIPSLFLDVAKLLLNSMAPLTEQLPEAVVTDLFAVLQDSMQLTLSSSKSGFPKDRNLTTEVIGRLQNLVRALIPQPAASILIPMSEVVKIYFETISQDDGPDTWSQIIEQELHYFLPNDSNWGDYISLLQNMSALLSQQSQGNTMSLGITGYLLERILGGEGISGNTSLIEMLFEKVSGYLLERILDGEGISDNTSLTEMLFEKVSGYLLERILDGEGISDNTSLTEMLFEKALAGWGDASHESPSPLLQTQLHILASLFPDVGHAMGPLNITEARAERILPVLIQLASGAVEKDLWRMTSVILEAVLSSLKETPAWEPVQDILSLEQALSSVVVHSLKVETELNLYVKVFLGNLTASLKRVIQDSGGILTESIRPILHAVSETASIIREDLLSGRIVSCGDISSTWTDIMHDELALNQTRMEELCNQTCFPDDLNSAAGILRQLMNTTVSGMGKEDSIDGKELIKDLKTLYQAALSYYESLRHFYTEILAATIDGSTSVDSSIPALIDDLSTQHIVLGVSAALNPFLQQASVLPGLKQHIEAADWIMNYAMQNNYTGQDNSAADNITLLSGQTVKDVLDPLIADPAIITQILWQLANSSLSQLSMEDQMQLANKLLNNLASRLPAEHSSYLNATLLRILKTLPALSSGTNITGNIFNLTRAVSDFLLEPFNATGFPISNVTSAGNIVGSSAFDNLGASIRRVTEVYFSNATDLVKAGGITVIVASELQNVLKMVPPSYEVNKTLEVIKVIKDNVGSLLGINSTNWANAVLQLLANTAELVPPELPYARQFKNLVINLVKEAQEEFLVLSELSQILQTMFTTNWAADNVTEALENLKIKKAQMSTVTGIVCELEKLRSVQALYDLVPMNSGIMCQTVSPAIQAVFSLSYSTLNWGRNLTFSLNTLLDTLYYAAVRDPNNYNVNANWSSAFVDNTLNFNTSAFNFLNITNTTAAPTKVSDLILNPAAFVSEIQKRTGMPTDAIDAMMQTIIPDNSLQLLAWLTDLRYCDSPGKLNLTQSGELVYRAFCKLGPLQQYSFVVIVLEHLDLLEFIYKIILTSDMQNFIEALMRLFQFIMGMFQKLAPAIKLLISYLQQIQRLNLVANSEFKELVAGNRATMSSKATFNTLAGAMCYRGFFSLFGVSQTPNFMDSKPSTQGDLKVEEIIKKFDIPRNATPFCLALYLDMVNTTGGAVAWAFIKPMLLGKILYTPDTPETRAIMEKRSLQNPFVQHFIKLQTNVNVNDILNMLQTYSNLTKMLEENRKVMDQLTVLSKLMLNLSSCVNFNRIQPVSSIAEMNAMAKELLKTKELYASVIFKMPPKSSRRKSFLNSTSNSFPLALMVAWVLFIAAFVKKLVHERELRLHEYMKMMGVNTSSHFFAWFIESVCFLLVTITIMTIILKAGKIFPNSNGFIIFLFLCDYGFSILAMSFLISSFFNNTNVAGLSGSLVYIICFFPFIIMVTIESTLTFSTKSLLCLFAPTCFSYAGQYIGRYEGQNIGIQWDNSYVSPLANDTTSFGWLCWLLLIDSLIYFTVGWYIRNVFPGNYGIASPWYFPVLPSFWAECCGFNTCRKDSGRGLLFTNIMLQSGNIDHKNKGNGGFTSEGEAELEGLPVGVSLHGLTKLYGQTVAIQNLNLNFYEGHVTALLGHNGAGKTTTMSLLTGLYSPSSGSVLVYGKDMQTHMDAVHRDMGVCMQYDVLFEHLTVKEHLLLYGQIKSPGWNKHELNQQVRNTLKETGMYAHRHKRVDTLSGGMKRKLSISIAFIGGSKTVVLDEPTTGVDPCSRRSIWDIVIRHKTGRTIILSTHHLDEAEVLSDRIAFLERGGLKCCGSPFHLKEKLGQGYNLTLTRRVPPPGSEDYCMPDTVTRFIQSHLPEAQLKEKVGADLVYALPPFGAQRADAYRSLLSELDRSLDTLRLGCYGISDTTLEEVFLQMTKDDENKDTAWSNTQMVVQVPSGDTMVSEYSTSSYSVSSRQALTGSSSLGGARLFTQKVMGMLVKRIHHSRRDWKGLLAQIVLPVLFVIAAMGMGTIKNGIQEYPEINLSPSLYGYDGQSVFFGLGNPSASDLVSKMMSFPGIDNVCLYNPGNEQCLNKEGSGDWTSSGTAPASYKPCNCNTTVQVCPRDDYVPPHKKVPSLQTVYNVSQLNVENYLLSTANSFIQNRYGGWVFGNPLPVDLRMDVDPVPTNRTLTKVWYNPEGYHTMPAYLNSLDNFILRANLPPGVDPQKYAIFVYSQPYTGGVLDEDAVVQSLVGVLVALCILTGYSIMTASFVIYEVMEYQTGAKRLQHISGVGEIFYWIVNFIYDMHIVSPPHSLSLPFRVQSLVGVLVALCILTGYSIMTASFVIYEVMEYQTGAKRLQHISGVGEIFYWIVNFIYDMTLYLVPVALSIAVIAAFQLPAFNYRQNLGAVSLLLVLFGFGTFPWMYLLAGTFKNAEMAFICYISINLFIAVNTIISTSVVYFLSELRKDDLNVKEVYRVMSYVFLIFPQFSFGNGLMELSRVQLQVDILAVFGIDSYKNPFSMDVLGWMFVALAVQGSLCFLLRLLLNTWLLRKMRILMCRVRAVMFHAVDEDPDVKAEQDRVDSGQASGDLLQLNKLSKLYQNIHKKVLAVNNISVGIPAGECFGLLGVNGAGKTTTFKMLTAEIFPSNGNALVKDTDGSVVDIMDGSMEGINIGYCPQVDALDDLLTGEEHLYYYARIRGIPSQQIHNVVMHLLQRLELLPHKDKPTCQYSCGTKRKLSTALALIGCPQILLLDHHSGTVEYHVPVAPGGVAVIFDQLECNKASLSIKHFSVSQTTLDEVGGLAYSFHHMHVNNRKATDRSVLILTDCYTLTSQA
ncbi:ATP-binding cassette sub-family A member 12 [Acipenser ruthenus]|uniref:ATP-binding cassette sub-family A member 12 n=1 Tax=Acipenser ruthenus TaxID=7906 RepID=A0A444UG79_ACIRT|nr:ATP-binding cassette sub-family A member 12 [Acipenser ruthenus]